MRIARRLQERARHHELESENARVELGRRLRDVRAGARQLRADAERVAHEEPMKFVGYAALAGAAAGFLASRRLKT